MNKCMFYITCGTQFWRYKPTYTDVLAIFKINLYKGT